MTTGYNSLDIRFKDRSKIKECWICSTENHAEGVGILKQAFNVLMHYRLDPVSIRLFGDSKTVFEAKLILETEMQETACPPLMISQELSPGHRNLNIQIYALSAGHSMPLYHKGIMVGKVIEDKYASWYMLQLIPDNKTATPYEQTQNIFDKAHSILTDCGGGGFSNTIRTWLFADNILSWYDQLNKARNQFYEHYDIYHQLVPASTGIGTGNLHGKDLATQILAVKPKNGTVRRYSVDSPLQCPALDYRSAFSRAVKMETPDLTRLYISGTASIDKTGNTAFVDDAPAQLELTMQVVEAILKQAGMEWSDTVSSLVYFKDNCNFSLFDNYCHRRNIQLPHIKLRADVCRNDLLYEIELDAVKSNSLTG